jgi:hypothetical protein
LFKGFFREPNETENVESNRTLSWEFGDTDNMTETSSTGEPVSEVMEFFEVAASLIRTLAPDSAPKPNPTSSSTT